MIVGTVKEIKNHEYRVGLTPESVRELTAHGHRVLVETGAGLGIGATDGDYTAVGAEIVGSPRDVFATAEMVVKVKEPKEDEFGFLRRDLTLFTYLHLAPDETLTKALRLGATACVRMGRPRDAIRPRRRRGRKAPCRARHQRTSRSRTTQPRAHRARGGPAAHRGSSGRAGHRGVEGAGEGSRAAIRQRRRAVG